MTTYRATYRDGDGRIPGLLTSDDILQGLGHCLEVARKTRGLNQYEAAEWLGGVNQSSYQRWERGKLAPERWRWPAVARFTGLSETDVYRAIHPRLADLPAVDDVMDELRRQHLIEELRQHRAEAEAEVEALRTQLRAALEVIQSLGGQLHPPEYPYESGPPSPDPGASAEEDER